VLAALSDRNRYRIVELLSANGSELSSGAIGVELGLSPSLISHHLSTLESTGLIERRKDGLWTFNRLRRDEIARHLSTLQSLVEANGGD
jgi:DNA-binding transcriptional ArsR family regulator